MMRYRDGAMRDVSRDSLGERLERQKKQRTEERALQRTAASTSKRGRSEK